MRDALAIYFATRLDDILRRNTRAYLHRIKTAITTGVCICVCGYVCIYVWVCGVCRFAPCTYAHVQVVVFVSELERMKNTFDDFCRDQLPFRNLRLIDDKFIALVDNAYKV